MREMHLTSALITVVIAYVRRLMVTIDFTLRRIQSFIMRNDLLRGDYDSKPVLQCVEGSFFLFAASARGRYYAELLISVSWNFVLRF